MSANRHASYEQEPQNTEVYEFSVADGTAKALTDRKGPDNESAVSPDGKHIAYVGFDDKYQGYQVRKLYVMNRDGADSRLLSGAFDRDVQSPRWAHDGSGLYFLAAEHGNTGLYFINLEGSLRKLASNVGSGTSAYGPGSAFTVGPNGAFAVTYTRPNVPGDIAAGNGHAEGTKLLTAVNEGLLTGKTLGQVEEIWYNGGTAHATLLLAPSAATPQRFFPASDLYLPAQGNSGRNDRRGRPTSRRKHP